MVFVKTIGVHCIKCKTKLFRYRKGGKGSLVKILLKRVKEDFTLQQGVCPSCGSIFARETDAYRTPALKIVGGKVYTR